MEISVCQTGPFKVNTIIVPLLDADGNGFGGKAFVVDVGGDAFAVAAELERRKLHPVALVCTHGHFDHVLGLSDFCKSSSTVVEGSDFYVKESMVYVCFVECIDGYGMFRRYSKG